MISSTGNQQIKQIQKLLRSSRYRKESKAFIVEGIKMVEEAARLGIIKKAYIAESCNSRGQDVLSVLRNVDMEVVSDMVMKDISDTITPQGILAVVSMTEYRLEDLLKEENASLIFLEDLRDPGNMGTIIRTAEGAGISGIIISSESVDLFNPKVVRSTMGSLFRMPFVYTKEFGKALSEAKKQGITLYAAHLKGSSYYDQQCYQGKTGIIIGNESAGITDGTAEKADILVKIPMCGQVESLNASVAAAVFMYEVLRYRRCH